jgi:uncharacterized membrane protein
MAGFLLESLESLFSLGYVQNRQGLVYGPFTPVYGVGALVLALCWPRLKKKNWLIIFAAAALVSAALEYLWSWGLELLSGAVFWDYSRLPFNLDGRVNLLFALFWGALGLAFLRWLYKPFCRFVAELPRRGRGLVTWTLAVLLLGDIALSAGAFSRQKARQDAVAASSPVELFLDRTYPDEWLEEQFPCMLLRRDG